MKNLIIALILFVGCQPDSHPADVVMPFDPDEEIQDVTQGGFTQHFRKLLIHGKQISVTFDAKVTNVISGDTITILDPREDELTVRLESIKAPEVKESQPFSLQSKQVLAELVAGKTVTLRETGKDSFGQTVAFVFVGDLDVSAEMIKRGMAWNDLELSKSETLQDLERKAKESKIGMWKDGAPVASSEREEP